MCKDHTLKRHRSEAFRALEVFLLGRGQEWVQDLEGRLEHLHKFKQALIGETQATRVTVGIGIVLTEAIELTDVHLSNERGNVLIVFIAGFDLGDCALFELARP